MFEEKPQVNNTEQAPGSLDIYKSSREYKIKQGFKNMTPKKRLMFLMLPVLAVAIGAILYFTLAAPDDPYFNLVWADSANTIDGASLTCGQTEKKVDILIDRNSKDIVSAAAFIKYDPTKIEVTKIDVSKTDFTQGQAGDTLASDPPGTMQVIDNVNGLVQVVRGQPAGAPVNGVGTAFTKEAGVLATLYFNVKPTADLSATSTIFNFVTTGTNRSTIVLNGGTAIEPNYDNSGNYGGMIKCCALPNYKCLAYEYCPNNNWYRNDANDRCCQEKCKEGVEFYLFERARSVEVGEKFEINVNMRPDYQPIKQIKLRLKLNQASLVEPISSANIVFPGGISGTSIVDAANGIIDITIPNYQTTNNVAATLATIKLEAREVGVLAVDFEAAGVEAIAVDGSKMEATLAGGVYRIAFKRIKLCENTNLMTEVGYTDASFNLCVTPGSDCEVTLTPAAASAVSVYSGVCDAETVTDHTIKVTGLAEGTKYTYKLICNGTDSCPARTKYKSGTGNIMYEILEMSGEFTTLSSQRLEIRELKENNVRATSASIEWNTIGGSNGDGLSDSFVCYREVSSTGAYDRARKKEMTNKHSVELLGLLPERKYEAYAVSAVQGLTGTEVCDSIPSSLCDSIANAKDCDYKNIDFTTKKLTDSADANVILKVNKDRICDEWLYCNAKTQVKVTNANPERYEDLCFRVGKCNKMDESGNCIGVVDEDKSTITVESPGKVGEIRNLSGYSKVGIDWGSRCLNTGRSCTGDTDCTGGATCTPSKIEGFYPYSQMAEIGVPIVINNANFENGIPKPWESFNGGTIENNNYENTNRVLKIWPAKAYQGAIAKKVANNIVKAADFGNQNLAYVVSFWAKSGDDKDRDILIEMAYGGTSEADYKYVKFKYYDEAISKSGAQDFVRLGNAWKQYVVSLSAAELPAYDGPLNIVFAQAPGAGKTIFSDKPFYVDNISMKSVLELGDNMNYAGRSCRLYPTQSAPACDYYDSQSAKNYKGWKGYCVETDPAYQDRKYANQPMCLMWWPVDIINGESNIFYKDPLASGYTGRKPLYYCLEGGGNYSRCGKRGDTEVAICGDKYEVHNYYGMDFKEPGEDGCKCGKDGGVCFGQDPKITTADSGYTFFICQNNYSTVDRSVKIKPGYPEYGLKEYEIAYVFVDAIGGNAEMPGDFVISSDKFGTEEQFSRGKGTFQNKYTREEINVAGETGKVVWKAQSTHTGENDFLKLSLIFDKQKGLEEYRINVADNKGSGHEGETFVIRFYLKEPCLKIAQVVDYDGNAIPRMERINSERITNPPDYWPGYVRKQDYAPYGSSLVPEPSWNPGAWNETIGGPLLVEPPDTSGGLMAPYQVRAGTPYGISNKKSLKELLAGATTDWDSGRCTNNLNVVPDPLLGKCFPLNPLRFWCAGSNEFAGLVFDDRSKYCETAYGMNVDGTNGRKGAVCMRTTTGSDFYCADQVAEGIFPEIYEPCRLCGDGTYDPSNPNCRCTMSSQGLGSGTEEMGVNNLGPAVCISGAKIGASCPNGRKDCGMAEGSDVYGQCVGFNNTGSKSWNQINFLMIQNSGEKQVKELFIKSYGIWDWKYDKDGQWRYVKIEDGWDATGIGVSPKVTFISAGSMANETGEVARTKAGAVTLYFGSWVDENQKPLVRYTVDWGDGNQSTESGLTISGRDKSNPHILVHYYKYDTDCDPTDRGFCEFKPKVQIEDNWGKCNEAGDCTSASAWKTFAGNIKVYGKEQVTNTGAIMQVTPAILTYDTTSLPTSQFFTVRNVGDQDLRWRISRIGFTGPTNWLLKLIDPTFAAATMSIPRYQENLLRPGEGNNIEIRVEDPADLVPGEYTSIIELQDMAGVCSSGANLGATCAQAGDCGVGGVCTNRMKEARVILRVR